MVLIFAVRLQEVCKFVVELTAGPERAGERRSGHMCFRQFRMLETIVVFVVSVRSHVSQPVPPGVSSPPPSPPPVKIQILDFTKIYQHIPFLIDMG